MILFVFEGKVKEPAIVDALADWLGVDSAKVECVYGTHIYRLYSIMRPDEDLDVFATLQGIVKDSVLDGYHRNDFSEIYMFFDYDAHVPMPNVDGHQLIGDDVIEQMLDFFDDESDKGLLYLSYPMAEALQHYRNEAEYKELMAKCKGQNCLSRLTCAEREECIGEPHYKTQVNEYAPQLSNIARISQSKLAEIIRANLNKISYLMTAAFTFPTRLYSQKEIFQKQQQFVGAECPHVAVLSGFAPFLADYLGLEKVHKKIADRLP